MICTAGAVAPMLLVSTSSSNGATCPFTDALPEDRFHRLGIE